MSNFKFGQPYQKNKYCDNLSFQEMFQQLADRRRARDREESIQRYYNARAVEVVRQFEELKRYRYGF